MSEQRKELWRMLFVILSGVIAAFLVAAFFVLNYGPSGSYTLNSVLLEPNILSQLNYNDYNPKTGGKDRFIFDSIEFEYYDKDSKQWQKKSIDKDHYEKFYGRVSGQNSIIEPSLDIEHLFILEKPSSLFLNVHTESSSAWQKITKVFQEVQFAAEGNYFRVELHEQEKGVNWVYFYHPKISQEAIAIFTQ